MNEEAYELPRFVQAIWIAYFTLFVQDIAKFFWNTLSWTELERRRTYVGKGPQILSKYKRMACLLSFF